MQSYDAILSFLARHATEEIRAETKKQFVVGLLATSGSGTGVKSGKSKWWEDHSVLFEQLSRLGLTYRLFQLIPLLAKEFLAKLDGCSRHEDSC